MKKLGKALGLVALFALVPSAMTAGGASWTTQSLSTEQIGSSCARYCREVCILNGEPCCFLGPNTCGCC